MAKQMKKTRIPQEAIAFLPDPQEIREERLRWYEHIGIYWIALVVVAILLWATFAEVDVIVRASGRIVADRGDIVMKPRESAVIESIEVKVGDVVEKGQPLLRFDPSANQAEVLRLKHEITVLQAQEERLRAEASEQEFIPSDPKEENARWQLSIYQQRMGYYAERMNYYESNMARIETACKATRESQEKYQEILNSTAEIEKMYANLRAKDVVTYKELLEAAMSRMQVEAQVDQFRNQLLSYDQQKLSLMSERNSFIEEWHNSVAEELVRVNRELDGDKRQLVKAETLASYVTLTAPCRAVVQDMASFPVGSAVGEAEAIITLVSLEGPLEVEAEIQPQDIGRVHTGSLARIKLSAFPFQKHGTLDGELRMISANTFSKNMPAANGKMQNNFYRGRLIVSGNLHNVSDDFEIVPGMETEVEFKTGKRRVIEYLIHPLLKGLDESFREP